MSSLPPHFRRVILRFAGTPMEFLYEDVRNARFGLHSEKTHHAGQVVYVLQLVNMQTGAVDQEKHFYNWRDYSNWYQQMRLMLQFSP